MIVRFINVIDEVSVLESVTDIFRNVLHEKQKLNELKELEILLREFINYFLNLCFTSHVGYPSFLMV